MAASSAPRSTPACPPEKIVNGLIIALPLTGVDTARRPPGATVVTHA
jgi:hypothetical protein